MKTAMLGLLLLLLAAAPAAAQAPPPDERAAAQAFADAGSRFARAGDAPEGDDPVEEALDEPGCERVLRQAPDRRAGDLVGVQIILGFAIRTFADRIKPAFAQFRTDLANIQTRDPALISGRAAMRRIGRAYAALAPAGDLCAELRAWRKAGYPRAAGRRARAEIEHFLGAMTRGALRKIAAAADRMRELGVSPEQADAFEGDGPGTASAAAQAARAAS